MDLAALIAAKLDEPGQTPVSEAVQLTGSLPGPEAHPPDSVVLLIFDVGQRAETLDDPEICIGLYRRVLAYPVQNPEMHAGAWYRIGLTRQRQGDFGAAVEAFQRAMELPCWRQLAGVVRYRLAAVLAETEDYPEAIRLLRDVLAHHLPNPEIEQHSAQILLGRTLLMNGQPDEALEALQPLDAAPPSDWTARVQSLRAEIFESQGKLKDARGAYLRIVDNPYARQEMRTAAAYRLSALR